MTWNDNYVKCCVRSLWPCLVERLREAGFEEDASSAVLCRFRLGDMTVDVMPDNEAILGFGNRWYTPALSTAITYPLDDDLEIKLLAPAYFIATKLEAWKGRGDNDPLASHDLEDILIMLDGRPGIVEEIAHAKADVRSYIAEAFQTLSQHPRFPDAIEGNIISRDRVRPVWQRWQTIAQLAGG